MGLAVDGFEIAGDLLGAVEAAGGFSDVLLVAESRRFGKDVEGEGAALAIGFGEDVVGAVAGGAARGVGVALGDGGGVGAVEEGGVGPGMAGDVGGGGGHVRGVRERFGVGVAGDAGDLAVDAGGEAVVGDVEFRAGSGFGSGGNTVGSDHLIACQLPGEIGNVGLEMAREAAVVLDLGIGEFGGARAGASRRKQQKETSEGPRVYRGTSGVWFPVERHGIHLHPSGAPRGADSGSRETSPIPNAWGVPQRKWRLRREKEATFSSRDSQDRQRGFRGLPFRREGAIAGRVAGMVTTGR